MLSDNASPPATGGSDGKTRTASQSPRTIRANAQEPAPSEPFARPLIDPRLGDIEDDVSSTKQRSLFAMAGSLLAEISLPKLVLAWLLLIVVPAVLLGLAPLLVSSWLATLSRKMSAPLYEAWPFVALILVLAAGYFIGRPLYRLAESGFWSLNSIAVQPGYALCRESLRHLVEHLARGRNDEARRAQLRGATAAGAGIILCGIALSVVFLVWPSSRWTGTVTDLISPQRLVAPALANAVVIVGGYLAAASLAWGLADASMAQPRDLPAFDTAPADVKTWRVAHLSDLHVVGERYGFRIESGRSGARGNGRVERLLARLDQLHAEQPLDYVLITGDITDAGRSAEWAEFTSALSKHPELAARTLILPGNHDVNVVDRANPARLDLPTSPGGRLRQMRALSAMAAAQGTTVRVMDADGKRVGTTLAEALIKYRPIIETFADRGGMRLSVSLLAVWDEIFPMVIPPDTEDGLGVLLINSTAETHFSFTNALGLVSSTQARRIIAAIEQYPRAHWILALHHHLVEYPKLATALSERIGTALINGSWFVRQLEPMGRRIVAMHGHRHIDWIGTCGSVRIISAPSPVMEATNDETTCFYVHRLAVDPKRGLCLLEPERIEILGETSAEA